MHGIDQKKLPPSSPHMPETAEGVLAQPLVEQALNMLRLQLRRNACHPR
jgi:hypothetical protein